MYKPTNLRQMVTSAIHQKPTIVNNYGVDQKVYANATNPNLKGEFKQKTSSETTANGVVVVKENITYMTLYKADIEASDHLIINGKTYNIKSEPDNVGLRNRYLVCYLERIQGGA